MLVESELNKQEIYKDSIVTVGVFDGVHHGHRHLIAELLRQAREYNLISIVVTFRQHPENLFRPPEEQLPLITDIDTRISLLKDAGVDIVMPLSFNHELANLDARTFVNLLITYLKMRGLVIGSDFALGKNREGNTSRLYELGKELGFSVTVVPPLVIDGISVSSTNIRKALADGDMERVTRLIGRYFRLSGTVISGTGRGSKLGFPTANLKVADTQALPPDGVYATIAIINNVAYPAMTNIGNNPTFGHSNRTIETFVLDYHNNLYGQYISIDFVQRIREERKFDSAAELKKQILEDIEKGRNILNSLISSTGVKSGIDR